MGTVRMTQSQAARPRVSRWQLGIIALVFMAGLSATHAATPEYQMKAAFLYNFAKLIEWPASAFATPDAPVNLCILGESPFGDGLDPIAGKAVNANRKISLKRLTGVSEAAACHILFVSASEKAKFASVIDAVKSSPVLTVSDVEGFNKTGGAITLAKVDNKVAIRLNVKATQQAQLTLSPQILRLATTE